MYIAPYYYIYVALHHSSRLRNEPPCSIYFHHILYCTHNITQRCAMRCNVASLFTQRVFMGTDSPLFTSKEGRGRCNRVLNRRIPLVIRKKLCSGYWHTRGICGFNGALGSSISLSVQYLFTFTQFSAKILPNNRSASVKS